MIAKGGGGVIEEYYLQLEIKGNVCVLKEMTYRKKTVDGA